MKVGASTLQACAVSGAKKVVLLPMTSFIDLGTVSDNLVESFSLLLYSSPGEAVIKAIGVE